MLICISNNFVDCSLCESCAIKFLLCQLGMKNDIAKRHSYCKMRRKTVIKKLLQSATEVYCKVRHVLQITSG